MGVRCEGGLTAIYQLYKSNERRIECVGDNLVKADMTTSTMAT